MRQVVSVCTVFSALLLGGCTSAYYKTMQTFGKEKRDILVQRVKDSKKARSKPRNSSRPRWRRFRN